VLGADKFYETVLSGELRPNVVHAHFGVDAVAVMNVTQKLNLPLVTTFHGFDATTKLTRLLSSGSPSLMRYALARSRLAKEGKLFICVSEFIKSKVLELGFPEDRVVKHFIGTNIQSFSALDRKPDQDRPVVLHVARLVEKKGTVYLLEAFANVLKTVPEARLVIIGEGPLRAKLESYTNELKLGKSVTFLGAQPHSEVLLWLSRAKVFALPSVTAASGDTEGLPISIIEASAAGIPVVATWHSGIPEAIEHEKGGLLSKERDIAALSRQITALLSDNTLAARMGAAGQQHVMENFDIKRQGERLAALYQRAEQH
jgi:glycosyltransferase involved in cell wall biosynthesis